MTNPDDSFLKTNRRALIGVIVLLAITAGVIALMWDRGGPRRATVTEYPMLVATDIPTALAIAPDGSVWFSIDFSDAVGVVRGGKVERFSKGSRSAEPIGIVVDNQGRTWVSDAATVSILGVSSSGEFSAIKLGTPIARLGRMAAAPDGSVWFAESSSDSITRLADGELKRHDIKSSRGGPFGVAVATDGTVWASLQGANALLQIAADGKTSEHEIPTPGAVPTDVAVDQQGAVWYLEFRSDRIGRFQAGKFDAVAAPHPKAGLTGLAVAPDNSVWFGMLRKASLGRLRDGRIVEFKLPRDNARPFSLAIDRSGNVWYTDIGGYVGMIPADQAKR